MQKMENCGGKVIQEIYSYAMMILILHNGSQQLVEEEDAAGNKGEKEMLKQREIKEKREIKVLRDKREK